MLHDALAPMLREHPVRTLDDRVRLLKRMVWLGDQGFDPRKPPVGGLRDPFMRQVGLRVTLGARERSDMGELAAIFAFVTGTAPDGHPNIRYTGDIARKDTFQTALRTMQYRGGDCLPVSTLVLRDDYRFAAIGELAAGERIMEDGRWTTVQEKWITGKKTIYAFELNNGSTLRCSGTHRLFRLDGEEVRARKVKVGDRLLTPREPLPTNETLDITDLCRASTIGVDGIPRADLAWLFGVYIADGWVEPYRFAISGRDGKPKEEQKRRVQQIMQAAGVDTRWHERYIAVNDKAMAQMLHACGGHAPEKRLPTLNLSKPDVEAMLDGLRADAGVAVSGTVVHSTTSALLALQLRAMYRMLGQSTHIRKVNDHGGLGTNPIYRVTVRKRADEYERQRAAVRDGVRVVAIRQERPELCADITTETGRFWLPESDTIVHNCDDHSVLCAVLAMENGFDCQFRITSNTGATWDHIYCLAGVPKIGPRKWVPLDTTLGPRRFGVHPPQAKHRDFPIDEVKR